ncbi:DNA/RNA non-specific endonuclease, partial [uncultured Fluviicola sp.]|uniref:DNA/RNA non-specific endonuclease n=1 Tax=uncultured Fluviicola sp. TaxID=463303 RepID=UPI0025F660F9
FQGYYEMVNGVLDPSKPYGPFSYPPADPDGFVRVVKLKVVKGSDGNCKLVREVVSYKKGTSVPSTVGGAMASVNDEIEFLDKVPGAATDEHPIECPKNQPGATGNNWNLDQYVQHRGADLGNFLRKSTNNNVKIILYDCATNKAKYTIGKSGVVNKISGTAQDQELNSFNNPTSSDPDVLIKGCIDNAGKWNYDLKLNPAKEGQGQVHPKMQAKLTQIKEVIRKHADEEVKLLKKVGTMNLNEAAKIDAGNGEYFKKANMDLFQSLAAICDIGKSMIKTGAMPETVWDQGRRAAGVPAPTGVKANFDASPFSLPSAAAGCTDQIGDEITGVVQLVETAYECIRHPRQTFTSLWDGVKGMDSEKIKQILSNASGHANYVAGGDRKWYQGGKHGVQASMILISGLKTITKGIDVVKKSGDNISDIQKFIPEGSTNHPASTALKNASDNGLVVEKINDKRLLTKNVDGGENVMVVVEKNAADTRVYKYNKNDYKDANGNLPTDAQVEQFVKQDLNEVQMPPHTSQPPDFPDQGPPATNVSYNPQGRKNLGWNKELNDLPLKTNHTYVTKHASFLTDANGKVTKVEIPTLQKDPNFDYNNLRNTHQQKKAVLDKNGIHGTDQGGHLLGSQFGGPGEQINLVPMKQSLNQPPGEWWQMEQSWATQVSNGISITNIKIEVVYGTNSRPTGFNVEWFENGTKRTKFHNNN